MKKNLFLLIIFSLLLFALFRFSVGREHQTFAVLYLITACICGLVYYLSKIQKNPIFSKDLDLLLYYFSIVLMIEIWVLFSGGAGSIFTFFLAVPLFGLVNCSEIRPFEEFICITFTAVLHMLSYSQEETDAFLSRSLAIIMLYILMKMFWSRRIIPAPPVEQEADLENEEVENIYRITDNEYHELKHFMENETVLLAHELYGGSENGNKVERLRVVVKKYFQMLYRSIRARYEKINLMILIDDMKGNVFLFSRKSEKIQFQSFRLKFHFDHYDKNELSQELNSVIGFQVERLEFHPLQFEGETFGLIITDTSLTSAENEVIDKFSSDYYTSFILGKLKNMKQSIDYFEKERETYNFISELNAFESVDSIVKKITGFIKYVSRGDEVFFIVNSESSLKILNDVNLEVPERDEILGLVKKYFGEAHQSEKLKNYTLGNSVSSIVILPVMAFNKKEQDSAIVIYFRKGGFEFTYLNNIEKIMYHSSQIIDKYNLYKEYEQKVFTVKFFGLLFDLIKSKKIDRELVDMVLENILMFFPVSSCRLTLKNGTSFGDEKVCTPDEIQSMFSDFSVQKDEERVSRHFQNSQYPGKYVIPVVISNHLEAVFIYEVTHVNVKIELHTLKLIIAMLVQIIQVQYLIEQIQSMKSLDEEFLKEFNSGVLIINRSGMVVNVNERCNEILMSKDQSMRISPDQYFHDLNGGRSEDILVKCVHDMLQSGLTELERTINYNSREIELSMKKIEYEFNEYYLILLRDNTEKIKQQRYLETVEKLASLGELSAGIAHEIRNPLGGIELYISLLKSKCKSDPNIVKIVDETLNGINDIKDIINNLLNYAKPQKGDFQKLKPSVLIDEILKIMKLKFEKLQIQVIKEYDEQSSESEQRIYYISVKQILLNILFNSIEAMRTREAERRLVVRSEISGQEWSVWIEDNGCGMDEHETKRVFDPFYTTKPDGTGLGMSIVHRIIRELNGKIEIFSEPGKGTTVCVRFPLLEGEEGGK